MHRWFALNLSTQKLVFSEFQKWKNHNQEQSSHTSCGKNIFQNNIFAYFGRSLLCDNDLVDDILCVPVYTYNTLSCHGFVFYSISYIYNTDKKKRNFVMCENLETPWKKSGKQIHFSVSTWTFLVQVVPISPLSCKFYRSRVH